MIVKELLVNALVNAGHVHEGDTAEADDIALALRKFNFELRRLSNRNLITAFQKMVDIEKCETQQVIGDYVAKKNRKVHYCYETSDVPDPTDADLTPGKDFCLCAYLKGQEQDSLALVETTTEEGESSTELKWTPVSHSVFLDFCPDVYCSDVERVVTVMFKNTYGRYEPLRYVPLTMFFTENDDYTYCTSQSGENKVKLLVPAYIAGRDLRVIYNSSMDFGKFDNIDLPDAHIAMLELAVTVAILAGDGDTDQTRLNTFQTQLDSITKDIMANTSTERRIMRPGFLEDKLEALRSGSFIFKCSKGY